MEITDILTEEEIYQVLDKVAKNHQKKVFEIHGTQDIYQQAFTIAWTKLKEFKLERQDATDPRQGLENWLNSVVSNRLSNFYRDNVGVFYKDFKSDKNNPDAKTKRMNLLRPVGLDKAGDIRGDDFTSHLECKELLFLICKALTTEEIEVLESLLDGEKITAYYKKRLLIKIKQIIDEVEQD